MLKLFRSIVIVLFSFLALIFPNYSIAELQSIDDPIYGFDSITYDTETGLEWLDLTYSTDMTYSEVSDEIIPGGYFDGFRRPATGETDGLLMHAGVPVSDSSAMFANPEIMDACMGLAELLGATIYQGGWPGIRASYALSDSWPGGMGASLLDLYTFITGDAYYYCKVCATVNIDLFHSPTVAHFLVREAPPSLRLERLRTAVVDLYLSSGISNSLDSKLSAASKALDDLNENNDGAAINKLQAFINAVEAQWGKHIPVDDAEALIATAQGIIDTLSSQ